MSPPEQETRLKIDALLVLAGWRIQDAKATNIHAARGVDIREFPLGTGYGFADYLLYVDGKAAGVIEAKKVGTALACIEVQSANIPRGCHSDCRVGTTHCHSFTNPLASKPASPTASTPIPARAMSFPFADSNPRFFV